jgi:hypothetical protein
MLGATGCGFYAAYLYPRKILNEILTAAGRERVLVAKLVTYGLALAWFLFQGIVPFTLVFLLCSLAFMQMSYGWLVYIFASVIVGMASWHKRHLQRQQS